MSSQPVVPKGITESKENKASPSGISTPSSPKRAQKRPQSEALEPRPFTKIRLQRPVTPSSPCPVVKLEPLDIPLSPAEIFSENNDDDITPSSDLEKLMSLHEEDDPGGEEITDEVGRLHFCELPAPPDLNDNEDQMEFVPTDFLEQQQEEIVEEPETSCNKDDSSKKDSPDYTSADNVEEDNAEEDDIDGIDGTDRAEHSETQPSKEKKVT